MEREREIHALSKLVLDLTIASSRTLDLDSLLERLFVLFRDYPDLHVDPRGAILLRNAHGKYFQIAQHGIEPAWKFATRWESPLFDRPVEDDRSRIAEVIYSDAQHERVTQKVLLLPLVSEQGGTGYAVLFTDRVYELSHFDHAFFDDLARALSGLVHHTLSYETLSIREIELEEARAEALRSLGVASEYRDTETGYHIMRMANYAVSIAKAMGLSEEHRSLLYVAAPMHDVGKIGIADAILLKPGKLTREEFEVMKSHTTIGMTILNGKDELIDAARNIAGYHHERWDGSGYPDNLRGEEIPLYARICAVADVFDALTSTRPYKRPWSVEEARDWIIGESGKHFDPAVVEAFILAMPELLRIRELYRDDIINPKQVLSLPALRQREHAWVKWDEILRVGIDVIDEHHRYLFDLVNDLHEVVASKAGAREVVRVLKALDTYAKIHFRAEEQMMAHYGFEGHARQMKQHHAFEAKLKEVFGDLHDNPLVAQYEVLAYLRDWLIHHIRVEDAKLAALAVV